MRAPCSLLSGNRGPYLPLLRIAVHDPTLVTQPGSHIIPPSQPRSAPKAIDAAFCAIKSATVPCRSAPGGFPPQAFLREERPEKRPHALACSGSSTAACCRPCKMTQGKLAQPAISSKLNPYAEEFRPKRAQPSYNCTLNSCCQSTALGCEGQASVACDLPAVLRFMDVPSEVTRYAFLVCIPYFHWGCVSIRAIFESAPRPQLPSLRALSPAGRTV